MEVVVSLSQGRTAAAQCGLFTHKSVPVIFEPPCINKNLPHVSAYISRITDEVLTEYTKEDLPFYILYNGFPLIMNLLANFCNKTLVSS